MNNRVISLLTVMFLITSSHLSAQAETPLFVSSIYEGNQGHTGPLGSILEIKKGVKITEIGAFESNPSGPFSIKVAIYDAKTKGLIPAYKIFEISRDNSVLENQYRFTKIEPIFLKPGTYVLVAQGYDNDQQNGNTGLGGSGPKESGAGIIQVKGSSWALGKMAFPTNADGNLYHAANLKYVK